VQVDPSKPVLKASGTMRLKLKYGKLLSSFAFKSDLRLYIVDYAFMSRASDYYHRSTKLPVSLSFFMCYYDAYLNGYDTIMAGAYTRPLFSST